MNFPKQIPENRPVVSPEDALVGIVVFVIVTLIAYYITHSRAREKPLRYLGVPGLVMSVVGMMLGMYLLWMFNMTRHFAIPVARLALGALIGGVLLFIAGISLHGLKRTNDKLERFFEKNEKV